ncbi:hypothetical protein LTR37_011568 [Vermiconidia calcicola]|uniref:Uncharacterized protein n=1 Tax=Vermiconidia calcicola TaxID=1690605 RepID=A0ACC3N1Q1_9PEZI|nr:hypothetical protein LTR37_011568 [Vermiconidia calcicola]
MPPKRSRAARTPAQNSAPAPPSSEDAKPNVEQLNAALEARPDGSLPSDPLANNEPEPMTAPGTPVATTAANSPSVAPSQPAASTSSSLPKGKKPIAAPKFAGRRSQAKREELQRAEEEKRRVANEARAAEEAAKVRRERGARREGGRGGDGRGRGGGRGRDRGRGGYMGERERNRQDAVASGPFSAGQVHKEARQIRRGPSSSGWTGLQPGAAQREDSRPSSRRSWSHATPKSGTGGGSGGGVGGGGGGGSRSGVKKEGGSSVDAKPDPDGDLTMSEQQGGRVIIDGGDISSDEEDAEKGLRRMNVEDLSVIDLTQDDDEYDAFAPVRVARIAHKERSLGINAEGATNQEGAITVDANDVAAVNAADIGKGKQKATGDAKITGEHKIFQAVYSDSEDDADVKPDPEGEPETDTGSSPAGPGPQLQSDFLADPPSSPETRAKGKEKIKARALSPLPTGMPEYQTREEVEEWERYQNDLKIVRAELGPNTSTDSDGDAVMDSEKSGEDKRADKVYLFQFPPVLPDLQPITVKPDPETANGDTDVMNIDPQPNNQAKPINVSDNTASDIRQQPNLPSGAVGKLKVHASGRVTLDWGGTALSLAMGTEASFLQDVMLASLPDRKDGGKTEGEGMAVSMGQVKGKFVVTPDWGAILG